MDQRISNLTDTVTRYRLNEKQARMAMRLALIAGFVIALGTLALSFASTGRIAVLPHSQSCLLRLQQNPPRSASIFFVGSSRMREAVDPDSLANALSLPKRAIVNIAHPVNSIAYDLSVIELMSRNRELNTVVFGVFPQSDALRTRERELDPRPSARFDLNLSFGRFKELYVVGATVRDQLRRVRSESATGLLAAWDFSRLTAERIRKTASLLKTNAVLLIRKVYPDFRHRANFLDHSRDTMCLPKASNDPEAVRPHLRIKAQKSKDVFRQAFGPLTQPGWDDPEPLGFFTDPTLASKRSSITHMVELARQRNFRPIFLYLPALGVPIDTSALQARFNEQFGAPLLVPDPTLRRAIESDDGYFDNSHLNQRGRQLFTPWLASELSKLDLGRLSPKKSADSSRGS